MAGDVFSHTGWICLGHSYRVERQSLMRISVVSNHFVVITHGVMADMTEYITGLTGAIVNITGRELYNHGRCLMFAYSHVRTKSAVVSIQLAINIAILHTTLLHTVFKLSSTTIY